jgi:glutamate/tyrosine decarboxylase-like PLP-dependent enzyme
MFAGQYIHNQAIEWVKALLCYPAEAGGVFVSGGSEANFTALAVARNAKSEVDPKVRGIQALPRVMTLYCSEEAHPAEPRPDQVLRWTHREGTNV